MSTRLHLDRNWVHLPLPFSLFRGNMRWAYSTMVFASSTTRYVYSDAMQFSIGPQRHSELNEKWTLPTQACRYMLALASSFSSTLFLSYCSHQTWTEVLIGVSYPLCTAFSHIYSEQEIEWKKCTVSPSSTLCEGPIWHNWSRSCKKSATWHLVIGIRWRGFVKIWCGNSILASLLSAQCIWGCKSLSA